jgi:hypothetical protein
VALVPGKRRTRLDGFQVSEYTTNQDLCCLSRGILDTDTQEFRMKRNTRFLHGHREKEHGLIGSSLN